MCDFDNEFEGLEWDDWMVIGPLAEDIVKEKRERERARKGNLDTDDYWDIINEK